MYEAFIIAHRRADGEPPKLAKAWETGTGCVLEQHPETPAHIMLFDDAEEAQKVCDVLARCFEEPGLAVFSCSVEMHEMVGVELPK